MNGKIENVFFPTNIIALINHLDVDFPQQNSMPIEPSTRKIEYDFGWGKVTYHRKTILKMD